MKIKLKGVYIICLILPLFCLGPVFAASYSYDGLNRVTQVTHADGTVTQYTYDSAGNRTSKTTTLAEPTISSNPLGKTTIAGSSAAFSVGASGSEPLTYSWKYNGADLMGANNWGLYFSEVDHTQAGNYTVVVSNNAGSASSDVAILEVLIPFDYWTTLHFTSEELADTAISGPEAAPLQDGVPNVLKFLHNIEPMLPMSSEDRAALPKLGLETAGEVNYLTLTYRDNAEATNLTVEVQASSDLLQDPWESMTPDVIEYLPDPDPVTGDPIKRVKVDVTGLENAFIRLKVSIPDA